MKTLLSCAFSVSFLATAVACAVAGERSEVPASVLQSAPASIVVHASSPAAMTGDLKPSFVADDAPTRRPVRVVLASPYAQR